MQNFLRKMNKRGKRMNKQNKWIQQGKKQTIKIAV